MEGKSSDAGLLEPISLISARYDVTDGMLAGFRSFSLLRFLNET